MRTCRYLLLTGILLLLPMLGRAQQNVPAATTAEPALPFALKDTYETVPDALKRLFLEAKKPFRMREIALSEVEGYAPPIAFNTPRPLSSILKYLLSNARPPLRYEVENGVYYLSPLPDLRGGDIVQPNGQTGSIFRLSFHPDGELLATSDDSDRLTVWQMNRIPALQIQGRIGSYAFGVGGKTLVYAQKNQIFSRNMNNGRQTYLGKHEQDIVSITHSPDGRLLVSSSPNRSGGGAIQVWDAVQNLPRKRLDSKEAAYEAVINNEGIVAAWLYPEQITDANRSRLSTLRKSLLVWNSGTGQRVFAPSTGFFLTAAFSPDGKLLAALNLSQELFLWDAFTLQQKAILKPDWTRGKIEDFAKQRFALAFSPNGQKLMLGGVGNTIQSWNVATGAKEGVIRDGLDVRVSALAFSRDGNMLAVGHDAFWVEPKKLNIWDVANQKLMFALNTQDTTTGSLSFRPKAPGVIATGGDTVRLWDFSKRGSPRFLSADGGKDPWGRPRMIVAGGIVLFHPEGRILATLDRNNRKTVLLWDAETTLLLGMLEGHKQDVSALQFSRDGKLLATGNHSGEVTLWEVATGRKILTLTGLPVFPVKLVFSPGANMLAAIGYWDKKTAIVWNIAQPDQEVARREILRVMATGNSLREDCVDLTDEYIAYEHDGEVKTVPVQQEGIAIQLLQEVTLQAKERRRDGDTVVHESHVSPVFSPDGRWLVTESGGSITFSEPRSGKIVGQIAQAGFAPHFTPDKRLLCRTDGGTSFALYERWDSRDPVKRKLRGKDTTDNLIVFDNKGDYCGTLSSGTARIWSLRSGQELLSLITMGQEDFVAYTPSYSNYYIASPNAQRDLQLQVRGSLYPFDQFALLLNRPDKVLAAYGVAKKEEISELTSLYLARLKRTGVDVKQLMMTDRLPQVSPLNLPKLVNNRKLPFTVEAREYNTKLMALKVYVNGVPVYGANGLSLLDKNTDRASVPVEVELTYGRNRVDVQAQNTEGALSFWQTATVECAAPDGPRRLYALLVGVSKYKNNMAASSPKPQFDDLTFADKDANDLEKLLNQLGHSRQAASVTKSNPSISRSAGKGKKGQRVVVPPRNRPDPASARLAQFATYEQALVKTLTNEKATRENVLAAKEFLMQSRPQDVVIVSVAGHGWRSDQEKQKGDYFFATHDADMDDPVHTALSYEDLARLMDGIPARNKLMLLDTCNSGEADDTPPPALTLPQQNLLGARRGTVKMRAVRRGRGAPKLVVSSETEQLSDLFVDLRRDTGAAIISAASAYQVAEEGGNLKNGVFTYAILQGVKESYADLDKDGRISVSELREYVGIKVLKETGGLQKPTTVRQNLLNDFMLLKPR